VALVVIEYHVGRDEGQGIVKLLRLVAGRLCFAAAVAAAVVVGCSSTAFAHAVLEATTPTAGSVLTSPPTVVTMRFGEPVEIPLGSVEVLDGAGRRVDQGKPFHPAGKPTVVAQGVTADLPDGGYVVVWRVISADSHPVHGAFTFSVGSGSVSSARTAQLLAQDSGSRIVGLVYGAVRALGYGAVAVLVGGTALLVGGWAAGSRRRGVRRLLWAAWAAAAATALAAIALEGVYGAGRPLLDAVRPSLIHSALRTRAGELDAWRFAVVLAAGGPLLGRLMRPPRPGPRRPADTATLTGAAGVGLVILATFSLAGHAATGRGAGFAVAMDLAHITAVSVWVGGLAMLVVGTRGAERIGTAGLRRFSQWALISVAVIAVSGGFEAWRQVATPGAVLSTAYGRLLVAKTVGFAVIVAFGAANRRRVAALPGAALRAPAAAIDGGPVATHRQVGASPSVWLGRTVRVELAVAAVVLSLAAVLVDARPAKQAYTPTFHATAAAGVTVRVVVSIPAPRSGPVAVRLATFGANGNPLAVPEIDATLSLRSSGGSSPPVSVAGLPLRLQSLGRGRFASVGLDVPIPGVWILNLTVRTNDIDEYYATPVAVAFR
jgi:copper transport protein